MNDEKVFCKDGDPYVNAGMWHSASMLIGASAGQTLGTNNANQNTAVRVTAAQGTVGVSSTGIVVGSGSTAVTISRYALATQIAHGVGAGQLSYAAQTYTAPTTDGTKRYWKITRVFTNTSGGTVTVREVGLYANFSGAAHMLHMDLTGDIAVANNQALTVVFEYSSTA